MVGALDTAVPDVTQIGESIFTDYLYAFEITSVLLVIAVVGAILLARRAPAAEEILAPGEAEREAEIAERMEKAEVRAGAVDGERPEVTVGADGADEAAPTEEVRP